MKRSLSPFVVGCLMAFGSQAGAADEPAATPAAPAPALTFTGQARVGLATGREGFGADTINARTVFHGQAHHLMKVELGLEFDRHVVPVPPSGGFGFIDEDIVALIETRHAVLLDAVVKLEFHRAFNVWAGRFRPPADRSSLSDLYFINAWNYPDLVHQYPSLAACQGEACIANADTANADMADDGIDNTEEQARRRARVEVRTRRDEGLAVWGFLDEGQHFKYQVGAFNLRGAPTNDVRAAGRITVNFLDPEPGYYNQSSYFGEREILALAVAGQYQRHFFALDTSSPPDGTIDRHPDLLALSADVLFEKRVGRGTVTLEGAYYNFTDTFPKFKDGTAVPLRTEERRQQSYFLLGAYLFPQWGPGRPQLLARYQGSPDHAPLDGKFRQGSSMYTIDAFTSYVLAGSAARVFLGYQFIYINKTNTPMWVQLGLQGQI